MSSSRLPTSKSLYIPSVSKSSLKRLSETSSIYTPINKNDKSIQDKQIVILERSILCDELDRLNKENRCLILEEINKPKSSIPKSLKLMMDEGLKMKKLDYSFLSNTEFAVIGVIGQQGTGKSTILSRLMGTMLPPCKTTSGLGTIGLDLFVTPDRMIFLDSQPLMSSRVLEDLKIKKLIPGSFSRRSSQWNEILSKRLATFLYSVCDILLVVIDSSFEILDLLKSLDFPENKGFCKRAKLIFIHNKSSKNEFQPDKYQQIILKIKSTLEIDQSSDAKCNLKTFYPDLYAKIDDVDVFLLPNLSTISDALSLGSKDSWNAYRQNVVSLPNDFDVLFNQFRLQLLSMIPLKNDQTEREWLKSSMEIWEAILRVKWPIYSKPVGQ